jgi:hypothetical protein
MFSQNFLIIKETGKLFEESLGSNISWYGDGKNSLIKNNKQLLYAKSVLNFQQQMTAY